MAPKARLVSLKVLNADGDTARQYRPVSWRLRPSAGAAWAWVRSAARSWCTARCRSAMIVSRSAGAAGLGFLLVLARAGARRPGQAVPMAGDGLAGVLAQVVPQVPPVGDLDRANTTELP